MKPLTNTLKSLIAEHSIDILQQPQRLKAMLGDLLPNKKRIRYLVDLSLRADMPAKLMEIQKAEKDVREPKINTLKHYFKEEYFLDDNAVNSIFECWLDVIKSIFENQNINKLIKEIHSCDDMNNINEVDSLAVQSDENLNKTTKTQNQEIDLQESFEIVWKDGLCGFMNSKGEMITPFIFQTADNFVGGYAKVGINNRYKIINTKGDFINWYDSDFVDFVDFVERTQLMGNLIVPNENIHESFDIFPSQNDFPNENEVYECSIKNTGRSIIKEYTLVNIYVNTKDSKGSEKTYFVLSVSNDFDMFVYAKTLIDNSYYEGEVFKIISFFNRKGKHPTLCIEYLA